MSQQILDLDGFFSIT